MKKPLSSPSVKQVKKSFWNFLINRLTITAILILLQFVALTAFLLRLSDVFTPIRSRRF